MRLKDRQLACKLAAVLVLVCTLPVFAANTGKQPVSLNELGSRDKLAALLYRYSSSKIEQNHLEFWLGQLENKDSFKTDGTLPSDLAVREIALTCLEAITGTDFLPDGYGKRQQVKELVTYRKGDAAWRFQIAATTEQQFAQIKLAASSWVDGFKRGVAEAGRHTASHR